jgi:hypothetical protein
MHLGSLFVMAVPVFSACLVDKLPAVTGGFVADGREFGAHKAEAWCKQQDLVDGSAVLTFPVKTGSRYSSVVEVQLYPDSNVRGVDVRFPWSHVVFRPADCSVFDVHVEHTPETEVLPKGSGGKLRLKCRTGQGDDSPDANVQFMGC